MNNKHVVDLPLSNRNLLQLNNLVAGVNDFGSEVAPATSGSVAFGRWSANGGMTNKFMLDGATAILANMNAASKPPRGQHREDQDSRPVHHSTQKGEVTLPRHDGFTSVRHAALTGRKLRWCR